MPGSIRENDADLLALVRSESVATVLDVGVGRGTYSRLLRRHVPVIDGIEAWPAYVAHYALADRYRHLTVADVRDLARLGITYGARYDLVIFGDVLEHMSPAEAADVWAWAHSIARRGLISLPAVHWPQGAEHGNPFEAHDHDHITGEHLTTPGHPFGPFEHTWVYEQTVTVVKALL